MRVLQFMEQGGPLIQGESASPTPTGGQVIVRLHAAAFNRRDYWIQQGKYPGVEYPVIPGADGAGSVGTRRVLIDAGIGWGADENVQAKVYYLIGTPGQGTFAEEISVPGTNVYDIPDHLSYEEAACLPVAGVTAYRALFTRASAKRGEKLLVTGVGGGVALMAVQMGIAAGLEVYVTSGSDEKIARAKELGARGGANYRSEDWGKQLRAETGGFDIVIDSAGGRPFAVLPKLCKPGGRIAIYGGSLGRIEGLSPQIIFWRQITILGTSMGSPEDFKAMLAFISEHKVKPVIDGVYSLDQANEALDRLAAGDQFGKLVITMDR